MQRRTTCNRDCPDACGILADVEKGRVVRLRGDPEHPVTRGFLCRRTQRFLERQYDPDRLLHPLIRRGSDFEEATWEEAFERIAERMRHLKESYGPAAIMHYRCGGSLGIMKAVTDYFFQEFGPVTIKSGDICSGAGEAAQLADFGTFDSHDIRDLVNARSIVLWGKNVCVSNVHLIPFLKEAQKRGASLLSIDPAATRTDALADVVIRCAPGGDAAIALAVVRRLREAGRLDPDAPRYCRNFDAFCDLADSRTVEQWCTLGGIERRHIDRLAEAYGHPPAATLIGWGLQRRTYGASTVRTIDALAAVSGNLGISGGGASFYYPRRAAFDHSFLDESTAPRRIPEPLLGPGLREAHDPPVEMVWITAANPVAMLPDSRTVARALRERFTVVVDSFLTDTARCAQVVLPTTTMLEEDDLLGAYGHHWLAESRPVIPPPESVKSDYEIVQELAPRVGLNGVFTDDVETWKRRLLKPLLDRGIPREAFLKGPVLQPDAKQVLFEDRVFATPDGRVNLITEYHVPPPPDSAYPLRLMACSTPEAQSAQWPAHRQVGPAEVVVHPDAAPGFADGQIAVLESARSSIRVRLKFDPRQRRDVALMEKGGWFFQGRCANELIEAEVTDAGECAVYYDTPVRVGGVGVGG